MNSADQFEAIVGEHYEPLFRFAMSLTRSKPEAWDLTQQTFYIWATKGHQLRDLSKVKTWLFKATNPRKMRIFLLRSPQSALLLQGDHTREAQKRQGDQAGQHEGYRQPLE